MHRDDEEDEEDDEVSKHELQKTTRFQRGNPIYNPTSPIYAPGSMMPPQTPGFAPETPGMGNYNPSTPMAFADYSAPSPYVGGTFSGRGGATIRKSIT